MGATTTYYFGFTHWSMMMTPRDNTPLMDYYNKIYTSNREWAKTILQEPIPDNFRLHVPAFAAQDDHFIAAKIAFAQAFYTRGDPHFGLQTFIF